MHAIMNRIIGVAIVALTSVFPVASGDQNASNRIPGVAVYDGEKKVFPAEKAAKASFINVKDYPSIHAAIAAAKEQKIRRIYIPSGNYEITKTIDLTGYYGEGGALLIEGDGATSRLIGKTGKDPVIDLTGSGHCQINDLAVVGQDTDVGILMARAGGGSAGWHYFYGLKTYGAFRKAAVYSLGSEVNRFVSCEIHNYWKGDEGGDGLVFTEGNIYQIQSPVLKEKTSGGCNTEMTMIGCTVNNVAPNSAGLKIIGMASDVRVYGSYFHSDGFTTIYLDGTKSAVDNVAIRDVRIEGEDGKHCLYAVGHVRNLSIDTGQWISNFEVILQEDKPSFIDKRYCRDPEGGAFNWSIKGLSAFICDGIGYDPNQMMHKCVNPKEKEWPKGADYVFFRFDRLVSSHIECKFMCATRHYPDEKGNVRFESDFSDDQATLKREKAIVVEKLCQGNTFTVEKKDQVMIKGEKTGNNQIVASEN